MKKTLALVLALAMVFSTITVAFAEGELGADAQTCADLGMLKGETGTVDAAYVATAPTRLQAAVMFLRLKGLEAEALAFTGEDNFADGNIAWAEGANLLAYLKANPQLGWIGDNGNFNPGAAMTAQAYYKVMLEALGYKQTTAEVAGDFAWEEVITFAASVGLSKVAAVENFTVNDLAVATVEALKLNVKGTEAALYKSLVTEEAAVAAGLVEAAVAVAVDSAVALGNAVVEVAFEDDVDASAANVANYAIEGLDINAATVSGADTVRLDTEAMTVGKLYTLTVGEKSVQFVGIAKVSGGPDLQNDVTSSDVDEVVLTFDKNVDFATASDVANYTIEGIEIVSAEVDEATVTLTTEGLKNKTSYTVKALGIKSIDGVTKKSDSDTFTTNFDLNPPKINGEIDVQTNERIVVTFSEDVTEATAEDLANYSIKVDETDGAELEIVSLTWDDNEVEIVTEPMVKREDYKLTVNNIADQCKTPNVMTRPSSKGFEAIAADETDPKWETVTVLSPTKILVEFSDLSNFDEASALDLNNYELEDLNIESIETLENDWKVFRGILTVEEMTTGESYDLTVVDVLDEFGNAMSEATKPVKATAASFASSKLSTAVATEADSITLTFTEELDEDSAENIANYSIDEEVGAPIEATLESDGVTVTLTVNDLINGFDGYDLTVDGVKDLAGNELYYEMDVDTTTVWNEAAPELEDADILNKYVISLAFDEKVQLAAADARLILAFNVVDSDNNGVPESYDFYEVPAVELVEDDTVVEFSDGSAFPAEVDYTVVAVVYGAGDFELGTADDGGITDLVGNPLLEEDITFGKFGFEGVTTEYEAAEVDEIEQVNGKTFEVTMSRDVVLYGDSSQNGFTVSVSGDTVTLESAAVIESGEDYTFDFASFLEDKHGFEVENADSDDETILTGEYTDEDEPYVDEVVATDRETITITFNEDILVSSVSATGAEFTLKNYDLDTTITINSAVVDGNEITLTFAKPLEARYEYELTLAKTSLEDIAGNDNESEDTFYFDGTDLAK